MSNISKLVARIRNPKLYKEVIKSAKKMQDYKQETVFKSRVLNELMSDKFEYKGNKPDVILVKDRFSGEPVQVRVQVEQEKSFKGITRENYKIIDERLQRVVGEKEFYLKDLGDDTYEMYDGRMKNVNPFLAGVGIRLDQMQIERALQLGINYIPRTSMPQSIIYHSKMGFLPVEKRLDEVRLLKQLKNFSHEDFKNIAGEVPLSYFEPIVIEKSGRFFIDINKTCACACIRKCREILKKSGYHRILGLNSKQIYLALQGKELEYWKNILKSHPILSKLGDAFNRSV